MSRTPTHTPTVPSFQMSKAPKARPNTVQPAACWRETSSEISSGPDGRLSAGFSLFSAFSVSAALASLGASPVAGELADAGLDLVEGDMCKSPVYDDFLTIYHDVGDGARRQRVDDVLFQGLGGPERRIVEIECDQVAAVAGLDLPD